MVFFKFIDEAIQTATVIIIFILLGLVIFLFWSLSPKILGILLCIAGVLIFVYWPHIKTHQTPRFITSFIYIGIILFLIGILLLIFA